MGPLTLAGIIFGGVAVAASAATAGLIVTTSGPFAGSAAVTATAGTPSSAASTTLPNTSTPGPTIAPGTVLQPSDLFDFAALPHVDQSGWQTLTGPLGTLTVRVPPGWQVLGNATVKSPDGRDVGDAISVLKPFTGNPPGIGQSKPGWVKVELSTQPFHVPNDETDLTVIRKLSLRSATAGSPTITAVQFGSSPTFPSIVGGLALETDAAPAAAGIYLNGGAEIDFPATAEDIAIARAIIDGVVVK